MRWLVIVLALMVTSCATPAGSERWQPIFDGRTLTGWTPKITGLLLGEDPRGMFRAEDGAIRVSYAGYPRFGGEFGHLFFNRPLTAFRIRFEYRFSGNALQDAADWQHSNSGIMILGQAPQTIPRDQRFPVSLEVQLLGAQRPEVQPTGNLCTPGTNVVIAGRLVTEHCTLSSGPVVPNGRWVRAEVEVTRTGEITHFIEGVPVLRYGAPQYDPADPEARPLIAAAGGNLLISGGYISLQAEGHPIEFRKIELMELE